MESAPAIDAEAALDKALSVAEESRDLCHEAELHRLKGELAARHDGSDAAEANFHKSIEVAQRQQSKAFELRATTSLARLYQRTNRRNEDQATLSAVISCVTQRLAPHDPQGGQGTSTQPGSA